MSNSTVEIIGDRERRRRRGLQEKLRIVAETRESGACVRTVAARHDVYSSLLYSWRRQAREGRLATVPLARFVPVGLAEATVPTAGMSPTVNDRHAGETIEIVLPDGCRLRVGNEVSLAAPRRVVTALRA